MNIPNYSSDKCDTVFDILSHNFIYNTIIKLFNKHNTWIKRKTNKDSISSISDFIIQIFQDSELYDEFTYSLRNKYKRINKNSLTQKQIFAWLTTIDYLKNSIAFLPLATLDLLNKKLVDILNFDSYFWNHSVQLRRKELFDSWINLLDEEWYEIVDVIEEEELLELLDIKSSSEVHSLPFKVIRNIQNNSDSLLDFSVILENWKELRDYDGNFVNLQIIDNIVITKDEVYFKVDYLEYIFDIHWDILTDNLWNKITNFYWLEFIWDEDYILINSEFINMPYYLNLKTKKILSLKKDWIPQWFITEILNEKINYQWKTYSYAKLNWETIIIDDKWNILLWKNWNPIFLIIWEITLEKQEETIIQS